MGALIPIVAITTSIGVPAAVIIIALFVWHKRKLARYSLIEKAIESNANPEVIEQLVSSIGQEENKRRTPPRERNLIQATLLTALGLSMFALYFILGGRDVIGALAAGAILIILALAKFVIALFIIKNDPRQS